MGAGIRTYIPSIVKIRSEVLCEMPYVCQSTVPSDVHFVKKCSQIKDAIAVLIFDGPKIIGATLGMPLEELPTYYHHPFLEKEDTIGDYYYFDFCALLKPYRSRGLAHHFFDIREDHVKHLKRYKKICLSEIVQTNHLKRYPNDPVALDLFWKRRGFIEHRDLISEVPLFGTEAKNHIPRSMIFWVKDI